MTTKNASRRSAAKGNVAREIVRQPNNAAMVSVVKANGVKVNAAMASGERANDVKATGRLLR